MDDATKAKPHKTTLYLDKALLAEAKEALGAKSDTETVHEGLRAILRSTAYQRTRALLGTEKGRQIYDVPRRREPAVKRRPRIHKSA